MPGNGPWTEILPTTILKKSVATVLTLHLSAFLPVITAVSPQILVAAHTFDTLDRPLSSYLYGTARFIHIDGIRMW